MNLSMKRLRATFPDALNPHPSALVESMRSMGYSPQSAIADLVDNSITAKSRNVRIELSPAVSDSGGWVRVEDDGEGMDAEKLVSAMRWGSTGPLVPRDRNDLG